MGSSLSMLSSPPLYSLSLSLGSDAPCGTLGGGREGGGSDGGRWECAVCAEVGPVLDGVSCADRRCRMCPMCPGVGVLVCWAPPACVCMVAAALVSSTKILEACISFFISVIWAPPCIVAVLVVVCVTLVVRWPDGGGGGAVLRNAAAAFCDAVWNACPRDDTTVPSGLPVPDAWPWCEGSMAECVWVGGWNDLGAA